MQLMQIEAACDNDSSLKRACSLETYRHAEKHPCRTRWFPTSCRTVSSLAIEEPNHQLWEVCVVLLHFFWRRAVNDHTPIALSKFLRMGAFLSLPLTTLLAVPLLSSTS